MDWMLSMARLSTEEITPCDKYLSYFLSNWFCSIVDKWNLIQADCLILLKLNFVDLEWMQNWFKPILLSFKTSSGVSSNPFAINHKQYSGFAKHITLPPKSWKRKLRIRSTWKYYVEILCGNICGNIMWKHLWWDSGEYVEILWAPPRHRCQERPTLGWSDFGEVMYFHDSLKHTSPVLWNVFLLSCSYY